MIRMLNVVMVGTSLMGLVGVYSLKYAVEGTANDKARIERAIERQEGDLSMLQADWAFLNQPAQIAPVVMRHAAALGIAPLRQDQFGRIDTLPMRQQEPDTAALDALFESLGAGVDPVGKLISGN
jgi:hypothetical protein